MLFNKKIIYLLIVLLVFSLSMNFVCASDSDNLTLNSFSDLNDLIKSSEDNIELENDYQYSSQDNITQGIVINKSCTIDGKGHTIDAKHSSKIFKITVDGVVLKNINFINGKTSDNGVVDFDFHSGEIINCNFSGNNAKNGGALYMGEGFVSDCNFINNIANETGGAIKFRYNYKGVVMNSNFINNSAQSSGAIRFDTSGNILNCNFIENQASENAGAVFFRWAIGNDALNCSFISNSAGNQGGAIYFEGETSLHKKALKIDNCNFINNMADAGGVIYVDMGVISNSNFINNNVNHGDLINYWESIYLENSKINGFKYTGYGDDLNGVCKSDEPWSIIIYTPKEDTKLIVNDLSFVFNNAKKLVITLKDENGQVLASKDIEILLNGKSYQRNTDSNGQVVMSPDLNPGTYVVDVYFAGDYKYNNASSKSKITISKATPKIVFKKFNSKTKKYTITLKDNNGKAIKNLKVTFKLNKKTYTKTTNSKGVVNFKITKKGTFKATIKSVQTKYYNSISKTFKIIVKK